MKRILLFAASLLSFAILASGQNIEITRSGAAGNHPVNDSTIVINYTMPTSVSTVPLNVINTGASSIGIKVMRTEIDTVSSGSNYLCWGLCYGSQYAIVWTAPSTQFINAHDTNKTFTADFSPNTCGVEKILYTFFSGADTAKVTIEWTCTLGVNEVTSNVLHISAPYPNPGNSMVSFNYHIAGVEQAKLEIYNTIGQCVQTIPVSSSDNRLNVNVSALPAGIYICKLMANSSQPVFQKLIVTH